MIDLVVFDDPFSCDLIEVQQSQSRTVGLAGQVGVDLRHGVVWLGDFGCGDQIVRLIWDEADLGRRSGGAQFMSAFDAVVSDRVAANDFSPADTGLSVRVTGNLMLQDGVRRVVIDEIEVLSARAAGVWE